MGRDLWWPSLARGLDEAPASDQLTTIWPGLPAGPQVIDYVPLDAQLRADTYALNAGQAEFWPIPLTFCTPKQ